MPMPTSPEIVLVGAGQLGSRYLQGLVAVDIPLSINVVDPSFASLTVARERLSQVSQASEHAVQFSTNYNYVPEKIDLALIVTPAHCRARVVADLASQCHVKTWILEKVLAQSSDQLDQINQVFTSNCQVWVNTPRRLMAWHRQSVLSLCLLGQPIAGVCRRWALGLACNAIHFIDLVSWWTQSACFQ